MDKTLTLRAAPHPLSAPLEPGQTWGQFQIVEKLGHGAFGFVYHARDRLDRDVALKILDGPEAIREGKLLARLQHPNLVAVHGYEETPDGAALCLELIGGESLEAFAQESGPLDPGYASLICLQICRGLAVVHGKGLVHRDIKAANVMRQPDGRIVLVDFGLGQEADPQNSTGEIAGTLPYMAPELFWGSPASPATDLYATGVLLYHLVTLQYPVWADSIPAYQEAHTAGRRVPLLDARPDLPESFIGLVEKAIDRDPARRFRSAGALALALEQVVQSKAWSTNRGVRFAWFIPVLALILAAGVFWLRSRTPADDWPPLLLERITTDDTLSGDPTLSGDGKLLAYASDQAHAGKMDIWLRQMPHGAALRLTSSPFDESNPAFSPDGAQIAFRSESNGGGLYVIPAFGGEPRLIAPRGQDARFSPDGRYLAYWVGEVHPRLPSAKVYVLPVSGGPPRQIATQLADARYPIWSPDSGHILLQGSVDRNRAPDRDAEWWVTTPDGAPPINTGALHRFTAQGLEVKTYAVCWYRDFLIFSAAEKANVNLWRATLDPARPTHPGPAAPLTSGTAFETAPWAAPDGTLVFQSQQGGLRIWSFALTAADPQSNPDPVTATADLDAFPTVSQDRQWLSFTRTSSETGIRQIWIRDLQSGVETALTDTPSRKWNPVISASSDRIAYGAEEGTVLSIYLADRRTRGSRRLCASCGSPSDWTPDSAAILASNGKDIQRVDAATGAIGIVLAKPGQLLDEATCSPDGRWIAFSARVSEEDRNVYIAPYGRPGDWQRVSTASGWTDKPHWSPDGKSLYFFSNSDSYRCIWKRAFKSATGTFTGPVRPVIHLHNARLSVMAISQPVRSYAVTANRLYLDLAQNSASIWRTTLPVK